MKEPKRPLSAYNLYYRFKRSKIIEAHETGHSSKELVNQLILATPGLEGCPSIATSMSFEHVQLLRRTKIQAALRERLCSKDTTSRAHRKSHGCLSFSEMNKKMCSSWISIDNYSKSVFEELAVEGRRIYKKRMAENGEKNFPPSKKKTKSKVLTAMPKGGSLAKTLRVVDAQPDSQDRQQSVPASSGAVLTPKTNKETNTGPPKHSLSAYNLFYRFKRLKITEAQKHGTCSKETIARIITALSGLEGYGSVTHLTPTKLVDSFRRTDIQTSLKEHLFPKDAKDRTNRKTFAAQMCHREMSKLVSNSWYSIDGFSKANFEELAKEGRRIYRKRVAEHKERSSAHSKGNRSSISGCLDRMMTNLPLSSGIFDPIHILPKVELSKSLIEERASKHCVFKGGKTASSEGMQSSNKCATANSNQEPVQCKNMVTADDFMKLISILDDNLTN
jgi:hypothetical protein